MKQKIRNVKIIFSKVTSFQKRIPTKMDWIRSHNVQDLCSVFFVFYLLPETMVMACLRLLKGVSNIKHLWRYKYLCSEKLCRWNTSITWITQFIFFVRESKYYSSLDSPFRQNIKKHNICIRKITNILKQLILCIQSLLI